MKERIAELRALAKRRQSGLDGIRELEELRTHLDSQAQRLRAELGDVPPEALSMEATAEDMPVVETARKVGLRDDVRSGVKKIRALSGIRIRLDLIPGIRLRYEAQAAALKQRIRAAVKGGARELRDKARSDLEALRAKATADALVHCGGDADRAKGVADATVENSELRRWLDAFQFYVHDDDPERDVEAFAELAEQFEAGERCL